MYRIQEIINDLWRIYTLQKLTNTIILDDIESFVTNEIAKQYRISNENSQLFGILENAFISNPFEPIHIDELLKICEEQGLTEKVGEENWLI